ncbi:adenosylmethionine decarboxylase [Spirillospora sp. CA-294931]|uniref:adenosylmethionine decarboxylase n=1 Tax=Spirillospora sp. CA-294931 TaxID=3240042 RepID=UPI003D8F1738
MTKDAVPAVGSFSGRHVLAEMEGIAASLLDDEVRLREILGTSLKRAGATVLELTSRRFVPHGVTVLALLSESHASVHTYPEIGSVFVDVFTCGHRADPERAIALMAEEMGTDRVLTRSVRRGHD